MKGKYLKSQTKSNCFPWKPTICETALNPSTPLKFAALNLACFWLQASLLILIPCKRYTVTGNLLHLIFLSYTSATLTWKAKSQALYLVDSLNGGNCATPNAFSRIKFCMDITAMHPIVSLMSQTFRTHTQVMLETFKVVKNQIFCWSNDVW